MAIPTKDTLLVAWSINADTRLTASPSTYGTTAAVALQYNGLHVAFLEAYEALSTAIESGVRSKSLTTAKDVAKSNLLFFARSIYGQVQSSSVVTDANKELLGVTVRKAPAPQPAPDAAPGADIVSVNGRTVKIRAHDAETPTRKGKPPGCAGLTVLSHVGAEPPANIGDWTFEGNTTRTTFDIVFPDTVAAGAKVWVTCFWRNERDMSGPACSPISTYLQFGGVSMAA
jgi:hypothetical protein